jgi:cell volume regulation protein A
MILGVVIGPILGIISTDDVTKVVPYFAAIALIIIMFDGQVSSKDFYRFKGFWYPKIF